MSEAPVIERITNGSNGGASPDLVKSLAITNAGELTRFNRWKQHLLVAVIVGARRMPPLVSSIQEPFSVWY